MLLSKVKILLDVKRIKNKQTSSLSPKNKFNIRKLSHSDINLTKSLKKIFEKFKIHSFTEHLSLILEKSIKALENDSDV